MIGGTHLFGKVDIVDERTHVATLFHHIFMLPLVYQGSFLVVDGARAVRIPLSLKSVLFAYLRFIPSAAIVLAILMLLMLSSNRPWDEESRTVAGEAVGLILFAGAILFVTYKMTRASETRARELREILRTHAGEAQAIEPVVYIGHPVIGHPAGGGKMSKWMKMLLATLGAAVALLLTWVSFDEEWQFRQHGKVALVDPIAKVVTETRVTKKLLTETKNETQLATMTYTSADGRKTTFKRYLSDELLGKFRRGEPVEVDYIPGEYNTERIKERAPNLLLSIGAPFLVFIAFVGWLVFIIRRK